MGNDQSRSSTTAQSAEERPPDYYELLQISEDAADDEIRVSLFDPFSSQDQLMASQRSYRKLAVRVSFILIAQGTHRKPFSWSITPTRIPTESKKPPDFLRIFSTLMRYASPLVHCNLSSDRLVDPQ